MPGALIHIGIGLLCALIVYFLRFKLEFSLAIFIGNLLPDVIKFGFSAIKQLTLNILGIVQDDFYQSLSKLTSSSLIGSV